MTTNSKPRRPDDTRFGYDWVTEETQEHYQKALRADALQFLGWRAKGGERRKAQNMGVLFKQWWFFRGPMAFRTDADRRRYKLELMAKIAVIAAELDLVAEAQP